MLKQPRGSFSLSWQRATPLMQAQNSNLTPIRKPPPVFSLNCNWCRKSWCRRSRQLQMPMLLANSLMQLLQAPACSSVRVSRQWPVYSHSWSRSLTSCSTHSKQQHKQRRIEGSCRRMRLQMLRSSWGPVSTWSQACRLSLMGSGSNCRRQNRQQQQRQQRRKLSSRSSSNLGQDLKYKTWISQQLHRQWRLLLQSKVCRQLLTTLGFAMYRSSSRAGEVSKHAKSGLWPFVKRSCHAWS